MVETLAVQSVSGNPLSSRTRSMNTFINWCRVTLICLQEMNCHEFLIFKLVFKCKTSTSRTVKRSSRPKCRNR